LATLRLRDRDSIITSEGLIFRVFGYSHPSNAYVCDTEYAPERLFVSNNPKAFRNKGKHVFYKFYEDEGWKFVKNNFSGYMIFHEMLNKNVVGVKHHDIVKVLRPDAKLKNLVRRKARDELLSALQSVLEFTTKHSGLLTASFGVFGSVLHGFYHPKFSDIDLIIYGRDNAAKLNKTLKEFYLDVYSPFRNEFENESSIEGKQWRFQNYSSKEFVWHQQRKIIYALFNDAKDGRLIKTEFEPVKDWKEIVNDYRSETRIRQKGWVRLLARVTEDRDAPFIPSIYGIQTIEVLNGTKCAEEATRIVSYMEEFRLQVQRDEKVYVEGNLEEVITPKGNFHQIALTYCPRYYEQVLKVTSA
jgi:predicted nucleotidyltransferase